MLGTRLANVRPMNLVNWMRSTCRYSFWHRTLDFAILSSKVFRPETPQRKFVAKRNMATNATQSQKDYLTNDLPQELLDQVIGYLDLSDQLKLRLALTSRAYETRIVPAIRPTLGVFVYLSRHPSSDTKPDDSAFDSDWLDAETSQIESFRQRVLDLCAVDLTGHQVSQSLALYQYLLAEHKGLDQTDLPRIIEILRLGLCNFPQLEEVVVTPRIFKRILSPVLRRDDTP
ncbi:hypothetical protein AC578_5026 [Pseudocercospora eumusae]|uniref:F-box domain-containing protein n=1 Tax=Pseudocercospora eumusae TaxID=321146 RepID=A0A139H5X8_9PEZI|nr:hypothetical protein AC578_5026 [Pseudocercospora eumusae]